VTKYGNISYGSFYYDGADVTIRFYGRYSGTYDDVFIRNVYSRGYLIPTTPEIIVGNETTYENVTNRLEYQISGVGTPSVDVFVDDTLLDTFTDGFGSQIIYLSDYPGISEGEHSWYINASSEWRGNTTYNETVPITITVDTTAPTALQAITIPNSSNVAVGTEYQIQIEWYDIHMTDAELYVDSGDGYEYTDGAILDPGTDWSYFNIYTDDYLGKTIDWYVIGWDETNSGPSGNGNTYTVSGSFNVVLDGLQIYVYDETTGDSILPSSVVVYNENLSVNAAINGTTNVSTVSYSTINDGKYVVQVSATGYYSRRSIVDIDVTTISELDYLIDEDEIVIYDTMKLVDQLYTYDYQDVILELSKPMGNGTAVVYSSYLDYTGSTATYLIAADQYLLKIITPDNTINYGWMTPDADGEISVILRQYVFADAFDDWIQYNYAESNESISFEYEAENVANASMIILNKDIEVYNTTSATDAGSFTYLILDDGIYYIHILVTTESGLQFVKNSVIEVGDTAILEPFPESYSLAVKSIIVLFIIIAGVLALSSYRIDLAGIWCGGSYAFAVFQDWCYGNLLTVSIIGIACFAAVVKFHRKDNRSLN